jgi:hypothetical protein
MFPVPSTLFRPRAACLLGRQIKTIDPRTLLHTFGTIGGVVRPKDVPKMIRLAEAIGGGRAVSRHTEQDCEGVRPVHARAQAAVTDVHRSEDWLGRRSGRPASEGRRDSQAAPLTHRAAGHGTDEPDRQSR